MPEKLEKLNSELLTKLLLDIVVESWRFTKLFSRLLVKLDAGEQGRYEGQLRWFQKKLEDSLNDAGMRLVNVEGLAFDPGLAARPVNIEEFDPIDNLAVDQMLEPIIVGPNGIMRTGTIKLKKV